MLIKGEKMIRIGLIGCGAAMQQLHLPAITQLPGIKATWIVDVEMERAAVLARKYDIPNVTDDYTQVTDVDAVLIGTPHYLHAPMTDFFLDCGVHVLCEKPLAIKISDAERLVTKARDRNLILAVGVFRRYYPISSFLRHAIEIEWLGSVERVDIEEGASYKWDLQTHSMMERRKAGGGVLIDTGSHTLDRLLWWFPKSEVMLDSYHDNSECGVETDCEIRFYVLWKGHQIYVRAELSRTRTLRNTFQIFMSSGMIEVPANIPDRGWFLDHRLSKLAEDIKPLSFDLSDQINGRTTIQSYFRYQLRDFCAAIKTGKEPLNAGSTVIPVVLLIESCYAKRQILQEPWVNFGMDRILLNTKEA